MYFHVFPAVVVVHVMSSMMYDGLKIEDIHSLFECTICPVSVILFLPIRQTIDPLSVQSQCVLSLYALL